MMLSRFLLTLSTTLLGITSAHAQTPATPQSVTITGQNLPPVIDYAKPPEYQQPLLSPNGQYMAVLSPIKGRMNLAVIDLQKLSSRVLTSIERYDVLRVWWVGNDRLVFNLGSRNEPTGPGVADGGGLYMIARDGSDSRVLSPTIREVNAGTAPRIPGVRSGYLNTTVLSTTTDNANEILVAEQGRTADGADVYRLDVTNGKRTLVTRDRPDRTESYVLDSKGVPRIAVSGIKDVDTQITWIRDNADAPWREFARFEKLIGRGARADFTVIGFGDDDKTLVVASDRDRETVGLFTMDIQSKQLGQLLAAHPKFDLELEGLQSNVVFDGSRKVIGVAFDSDRREVVWFDEELARLQAMVDKALPQRMNVVRKATDAGRSVVTSYSDVNPPMYYLYDDKAKKLEPLVSAMPWMKAGHLVPMRAFDLPTRDGLSIPSFYFLPANYKPGDKLPTVLHIHGGPHVRADRWHAGILGGFGVAEAQMLASRGYAVVLPNFRITPGLGKKIYLAGRGSFGRSMSEDHEDAVKWAVAQGFADPKRVCITGASYGGYATMRALAKTPDMFKCGIAGLMVSDIDLQLSSMSGDTATSTLGQEFWRRFILDEPANPGIGRSVSPVHQAERIKSPTMIYAGAADIRTPIEQTNNMVSALKRAGQNPEVLIKTEEGHGFGVFENRVELWTKMLAFLEKHIGVGPAPR